MRGRSALALLVTPVVLAVGCGGADEDAVVIEATPAGVQSASQATLDAETASVEFSLTVDPGSLGLPGGSGSIELSGDGQVDFANQRSEMSFDLGSLTEGLGTVGENLPAGMLDQPLRVVQDHTTAYVCFALFQMFAGSDCLMSDLTGQLGDDTTSSLLTGGGLDPAALLESLGGAGTVQEVGEEEIFGTTTRHLSGTFTLADAVDGLDAATAAEVQQAFTQLGVTDQFATTPQAFDLWVDGDGRVRQARLTLDLRAVAGEDAAPVVTELRFVELGQPVDIAVPADAADISELPGFLGGN